MAIKTKANVVGNMLYSLFTDFLYGFLHSERRQPFVPRLRIIRSESPNLIGYLNTVESPTSLPAPDYVRAVQDVVGFDVSQGNVVSEIAK